MSRALIGLKVAGDSHLAREEDAHEGEVGLHASGQEQQVQSKTLTVVVS